MGPLKVSAKTRVVAFDTETALIRPGKLAPELACLTYQVATAEGVEEPQIVTPDDPRCLDLMASWLADPETLIVGHNVAFDLAVYAARWPHLVPAIFAAYEAERVTDTQIREQVNDIALARYRQPFEDRGKKTKRTYDLAAIAWRRLGVALKKDGWRLRYGEFLGLPLAQWLDRAVEIIARAQIRCDAIDAMSGGAEKMAAIKAASDDYGIITGPPSDVITYPLKDAATTMAVFLDQPATIMDEHPQAMSAWWKHLMSAWGLLTHPGSSAQLEHATLAEYREIERRLQEQGLVKVDGTRDTKAAQARMVAVCEKLGRPVRKTDPSSKFPHGQVQLDEDACSSTQDPVLLDYATLGTLKSVLSKDVGMIEAGGYFVVHTRMGLAETGRSTSSGPNIQNLRTMPGIRECFVPSEGWVFAQADYSGLELSTLAEVCINVVGFSKLGEAINAGHDPHLMMAANILGISFEEAVARKGEKAIKKARQLAKVANFGFPGGLGAATFVAFARASKVVITEEEAKRLKAQWLETWPEMSRYFAWVNALPEDAEGRTVVQLYTGRVRGGATYTAACNSMFQGLGADATQRAGFYIARACYAEPDSPLYGCRIVAYIHDEFILECPADRAPEAAEELARLMMKHANELLRNVPVKTEPVLMSLWCKDARALRDPAGRLVPWSPSLETAIQFAEGVAAIAA